MLKHTWTRNVSQVSMVAGIRWVVVPKRRTIVAFELACCPRLSKVSTVTGMGGSWSRNAKLSLLLDSPAVLACPKRQPSQERAGRSRNADLSSLLASCLVVASRKCQQSHFATTTPLTPVTVDTFETRRRDTRPGMGGSWSQNAEPSSILDS